MFRVLQMNQAHKSLLWGVIIIRVNEGTEGLCIHSQFAGARGRRLAFVASLGCIMTLSNDAVYLREKFR